MWEAEDRKHTWDRQDESDTGLFGAGQTQQIETAVAGVGSNRELPKKLWACNLIN